MKKRIVICADGTWNRPEKDLEKDVPTNVLRLARAIKPVVKEGLTQEVFYDWGIGSYYDKAIGGVTGNGIEKNVMDDYRYIVQNYSPDDELFFFGFSRGAYTVRSLCGLIYNCGILKRTDAKLIQTAFDLYKNPDDRFKPRQPYSVAFRKKYSHPKNDIKFVGVWDTVGALGIPVSFMGFLNKNNEFYDNRMGANVRIARHAMAIDELRSDFKPTIWEKRDRLDLKQVWFAGSHSDIGGGYPRDDTTDGFASDIALNWMMDEAHKTGKLVFESHLEERVQPNPESEIHESRKFIYRSKRAYYRPLDHGNSKLLIHKSVKERYEKDEDYNPKNLRQYLKKHRQRWPELVE